MFESIPHSQPMPYPHHFFKKWKKPSIILIKASEKLANHSRPSICATDFPISISQSRRLFQRSNPSRHVWQCLCRLVQVAVLLPMIQKGLHLDFAPSRSIQSSARLLLLEINPSITQKNALMSGMKEKTCSKVEQHTTLTAIIAGTVYNYIQYWATAQYRQCQWMESCQCYCTALPQKPTIHLLFTTIMLMKEVGGKYSR